MMPMRPHRSPGRAGSALIELMAALFVLTAGLLASVELYHFGIDKLRAARESAVAVTVLQDQIERLRARPFAELADTPAGPFLGDAPLPDDLPNAHATLEIAPYPASTPIRKVTASIAWTGENGRTIRKELTTLVAAEEAP